MRADILVTAMLYLVTLAGFPENATQADANTTVRALENAWIRADAIGDVRAVNMLLDSSMIYVDEEGALLSRAQFLNRFAQRSANDPQWLLNQEMGVHLYGDTALVVGSYRVKAVRAGKPYVWTGRFIDTWVLKDGQWRCVVAQATPIQH